MPDLNARLEGASRGALALGEPRRARSLVQVEVSDTRMLAVRVSGDRCGSHINATYCELNVGDVIIVAPMLTSEQVVHSDPEIMGGEPVFVGTRVPLYNLFDYLEAGDSLEVFLEQFPSVSREQAVAALELAKEAVAAVAYPHR